MALAQAALGYDEQAIATACRRLALDPLDEAAHRTLMQLSYAHLANKLPPCANMNNVASFWPMS
ncbi:MAG: hypothetical protein R3A44_13210 [Caldilineaceae bacterium]